MNLANAGHRTIHLRNNVTLTSTTSTAAQKPTPTKTNIQSLTSASTHSSYSTQCRHRLTRRISSITQILRGSPLGSERLRRMGSPSTRITISRNLRRTRNKHYPVHTDNRNSARSPSNLSPHSRC
jgi:hypothetical protein